MEKRILKNIEEVICRGLPETSVMEYWCKEVESKFYLDKHMEFLSESTFLQSILNIRNKSAVTRNKAFQN